MSRVFSREHHGLALGAAPGIVVRTFRSNHAADRHEHPKPMKIWSAHESLFSGVEVVRYSIVPESRSRSRHILSQRAHDAIWTSAVLEDCDSA
jgi:hypothetical protein